MSKDDYEEFVKEMNRQHEEFVGRSNKLYDDALKGHDEALKKMEEDRKKREEEEQKRRAEEQKNSSQNKLEERVDQRSPVEMQSVSNENLKYGARNVSYAVIDDYIKIQGNVSWGGSDWLLPKTYQMKNGQIRIGKVYDFNQSVCRNIAGFEVTQVLLGEVVANDIKDKASKAGRELTDVEKDFITKHEQDMKDWGLVVQKDGSICQKETGHTFTPDCDHTKVNPKQIMNNSRSR